MFVKNHRNIKNLFGISASVIGLTMLNFQNKSSCEQITNPSKLSKKTLQLLFDSGRLNKELQQIHPYSSNSHINKLFYGYHETRRDILTYCESENDFYYVLNPYSIPEDELFNELMENLYKMKHAEYVVDGKKAKHLFYEFSVVQKAVDDLKIIIEHNK